MIKMPDTENIGYNCNQQDSVVVCLTCGDKAEQLGLHRKAEQFRCFTCEPRLAYS